MPDLSLIEGAAILLSGMAIGRWWPARRRKVKETGPVCGCKHHVSFHEQGSGPCHKISSWDMSRCSCRKYTGPEPLPEFYAPEIGG